MKITTTKRKHPHTKKYSHNVMYGDGRENRTIIDDTIIDYMTNAPIYLIGSRECVSSVVCYVCDFVVFLNPKSMYSSGF